MLQEARKIYWWSRGLLRSRRLAFFVSEQQSLQELFESFDLRFGGLEHADAVQNMAALRGHDPAEYLARLTAGHFVAFAVGKDEELQSWGWATAPSTGAQDAPWEFGIRMRVMPEFSFLWDYVTMPDYRGRGLYKAVLRYSAQQCFLRGARRSWGYADITNAASGGGLTGANYAKELEIHITRIGPVCHISRPGFQCATLVGGVVEMRRLLPQEP